ncbi:MAG: hypothetical protein EAZ97_15470, partial [Bacteroidetes bacterium]
MEAENYENSLDSAFRKQEGIFYSSEIVAQYLVNQAVGEYLLESKNLFEDLQKITILDPSCGAGVFLLTTFDYLLQFYQKHFPKFSDLESIKKHIIENNLFAVDLDIQAVEIAKKQLFEKSNYFSNNIKRGNSLIDDPKITEWAFDWKKQFPNIKNGFDIVIGNPPYVRADLDDAQYQKERKWITEHYEFLYEKWDLMTAFYERALKFLLKKEGAFSFISSNAINTSKYAEKLQKWMCENFDIKSIDYFENIEVFEGVGVIPTIIAIKKAPPKDRIKKNYHKNEFGNITSEILDLTKVINKQAKIFRQQYE